MAITCCSLPRDIACTVQMGSIHRRHKFKETRFEEEQYVRSHKSPPSSRCQGVRNVASFLLVAAAFAVFITNRCISYGLALISEPGVEQYNKNNVQPSIANSNKNKDEQCSDILLYLEDTFASMGIGCQLNNYVLATVVLLYINRRLVILSKNRFKTWEAVVSLVVQPGIHKPTNEIFRWD